MSPKNGVLIGSLDLGFGSKVGMKFGSLAKNAYICT